MKQELKDEILRVDHELDDLIEWAEDDALDALDVQAVAYLIEAQRCMDLAFRAAGG